MDLCKAIPIHPLNFSLQDMGKASYMPHHRYAKDPLVKLQDYNIAHQSYAERKILIKSANPRVYAQHEPKHMWLRKTAAAMLQEANGLLAPLGIEVYVKSAYRPLGLQQEFWDYFINQAKKELGSNTPQSKLEAHASQFCADPSDFNQKDPGSYSPHMAGGAVDVTLRNILTKEELFLDPPGYGERNLTHFVEQHPEKDDPNSHWHKALKNRRILFNAMCAVGFTNNPHEWWHYDFGTALYGLSKDFEEPTYFYEYVLLT